MRVFPYVLQWIDHLGLEVLVIKTFQGDSLVVKALKQMAGERSQVNLREGK